MKKKIHITGGCGYVGSRVAAALAKRGYELVIVDKATPEERRVTLPKGAEFRKADLTEAAVAKEALKDAEHVIHLASNIGPVNYMWDRQGEIMWENSAIDSSLYPAMLEAGTKLVLYSSSSMISSTSRGSLYKPHLPRRRRPRTR